MPKPDDRPADTQGQQAAARAIMLLGALCGAALFAGGLWLLALAFDAGRILPTRAGLGVVLALLGALGGWTGIYAANHSRLEAGKLVFDAQAKALIASPRFVRVVKVCGHAAGVTLLMVSWLAVYYPQGIALQ